MLVVVIEKAMMMTQSNGYNVLYRRHVLLQEIPDILKTFDCGFDSIELGVVEIFNAFHQYLFAELCIYIGMKDAIEASI